LKTIGEDLIIQRNADLTSLDDLASVLQTVGTAFGGNVLIENNPQLDTLGGIQESVSVVKGQLRILNNGEIPEEELAEFLTKMEAS